MKRFILTLLPIVALLAGSNYAFSQAWFDNSWTARRSVVIDNTARTIPLTDYAVKVLLSPDNFNFPLAKPDGSDLRATDADGVTPLAFWIQCYAPTAATVWIKVPSIPAGATCTVYLYYGNPSAASASNGAATFMQFSDFDQTFKVNSPGVPGNFSKMVRTPDLTAPLIPLGGPGEYDHWGFREHGNMLVDTTDPDTSRRYKMWYSVVGDSAAYNGKHSRIAGSFSSDGVNWIKQGIISVDVDTAKYGEDPFVVKVGNQYFMYYEAKQYDPTWDRVGVLTSIDALHWTQQGIAVGPDASRPWMDSSPSSPTVWVDYGASDTTWYVYFEAKGSCFNCGNGQIGLATSHDGLHFSVYGMVPDIPLGGPPDWDNSGMVPDAIFRYNGQYWIVYHGESNSSLVFKAGFAVSTDLLHWTKVPAGSGDLRKIESFDPQFYWDRNGSLLSTESMPAFHSGFSAIYRTQLCTQDTSRWPYGNQWTLVQKGGVNGLANDSAGALTMSGEGFIESSTSIVSTQRYTDGFAVEMRAKCEDYGSAVYSTISIGSGNVVDMPTGGNEQWETTVLQSGYACFISSHGYMGRMRTVGGLIFYDGSWDNLPYNLLQHYTTHRLIYDDTDSLKWYVGDTLRLSRRDANFATAPKRILISQGEYVNGAGGLQSLDWVLVRKYVHHEPFTRLGTEDINHYVNVVAPNGGELWTIGAAAQITWNSAPLSEPVRLELNRDYPAGNWELLADSLPNTGQHSLSVSGAASDHCRIRISLLGGGTTTDVSDGDFRIVPRLVVLAPDGGDLWVTGRSDTVRWLANGVSGLLRVELNRTYPSGDWQLLADNLSNTGWVAWQVTGPPSTTCRVRVSEIGTEFSDISDSSFSIAGVTLQLVSPNGGEQWRAGSTDTVRWSSQYVSGPVRIELNRAYPEGAWEMLADGVEYSGQYVLAVNGLWSEHCRVRVSSMTDSLSDVSDGDFRIIPNIVLLSPMGGEHWLTTESHTLRWQALGVAEGMRVELNRHYPAGMWEVLGDSLPNTDSLIVHVSAPLSDSCRVRVDVSGTAYEAISDSDFSIAAPMLHVLSPNGGEQWKVGMTDTVRWSSQFVSGAVRIELNRAYPEGVWELVADGVENSGQHVYPVNGLWSEHCRVRVSAITDSLSDVSDGDFRIIPNIVLLSPMGGEHWLTTESHTVKWQALGVVEGMRVELNRHYPSGLWEVPGDSLPNTDSLIVHVSAPLSDSCRVRVGVAGTAYEAVSDSNFSIAAPMLHVLSPNGGEQWKVGMTDTVRWSSQFVSGAVRIELNRAYPEGVWELVADGVENSGQHVYPVNGLWSEHCRVRVSAVSDSLSDVSDGDFRITPSVVLLSPMGGEHWLTTEAHTVKWQALGVSEGLRVELNRHYPSGLWEVLGDSLPNTDSLIVHASAPLSDSCRVRVGVAGTAYEAVSDSNFSIAAPMLHVLSPNGGEQWKVGTTDTVRWTSLFVSGAVRIELNRAYPEGAWEVLADSAANSGRHVYPVNGIWSEHCRVRVSAMTDSLSDVSDGDFHIIPSIALLSPMGGEHWLTTESHTVRWQALGVSEGMRVELNRHYPSGPWEVLGDSLPNTDSLIVHVSAPLSDSCRVRVGVSGTAYEATSDSNFSIASPMLHVLSPNGGEQWKVGTTDTVRWSSQFVSGAVRIQLNRGYPDSTWELLADSLQNTGTHVIEVTGLPAEHCRIRVEAVSDSMSDISDGDFRIVPDLRVLAPNGGDFWRIGQSDTVRWLANGINGLLRVELARDSASTVWQILADSLPNTGWYAGQVTGPASASCRIRVSEIATGLSDLSDSAFSIADATLHLTSPNGAELWRVGVPATVHWTSEFVTGPVRIELNRAYPDSAWEVLADSVANTGAHDVEVTEPLADHCRIRVAVISDSITDVSDEDFRIVPDVRVTSPDGGEHWRIHETNQVLWVAAGWPGLIRLELNRDYPSGPWKLLADSLENTGNAYVQAGDSVTDACRVRISTVGAEFSAVSDSDFAITTSQGFLALVRPQQPGMPITSWDIGTVECPATPTDTFLLRNLGDQDVTVYYTPEPSGGTFSQRSSCGDQVTLPAGEMSACELILTFGLPDQDGAFQDTLLIPTDAANESGGFVRIPLSGQRVATPPPPELTLGSEAGGGVRLWWTAVTQSTGGCALPSVRYNVYSASSMASPLSLFTSTSDTTCVDTTAVPQFGTRYYVVTVVADPPVWVTGAPSVGGSLPAITRAPRLAR